MSGTYRLPARSKEGPSRKECISAWSLPNAQPDFSPFMRRCAGAEEKRMTGIWGGALYIGSGSDDAGRVLAEGVIGVDVAAEVRLAVLHHLAGGVAEDVLAHQQRGAGPDADAFGERLGRVHGGEED